MSIARNILLLTCLTLLVLIGMTAYKQHVKDWQFRLNIGFNKQYMAKAWIKDRFKMFEGYRDHVYLDSEGNPTGGWGHHFYHGSKLPEEIWEKILDYDIACAEKEYDKLNLQLDPIRKAIVIDLILHMGIPKLCGFVKMLSALKAGDYKVASRELLESVYAEKYPKRAHINAKILETGVLEE